MGFCWPDCLIGRNRSWVDAGSKSHNLTLGRARWMVDRGRLCQGQFVPAVGEAGLSELADAEVVEARPAGET